jgi:dTMP kinase
VDTSLKLGEKMRKSSFITFEGLEGSGKSTQVRLLKEFLEDLGHIVVVTKEPGASVIGGSIRKVLLEPENEVSLWTEVFLFQADRADHIANLIKPALEEGKIVICDRHSDSSVALQGYGRGVGRDTIASLNTLSTQGITPDLTILLDLSVDAGFARISKRGQPDRMEKAGSEFHERVRQGFLEEARLDPKRIVVVDAERNQESIQEDIRRIVLERIKERV